MVQAWMKAKTIFVMMLVTMAVSYTVILGSFKLNFPSTTRVMNNLIQPKKPTPREPPHIDFSFIKIHRVGSGTFHNVLVRFAINHNAFVALADVSHYQVFPRQISRKLLLPDPQNPNFTSYNMFIDHVIFNKTATDEILDHVIFNKTATDEILPKDVRYITQIRHPYTHAAQIYAHLTNGRPYKWYNSTAITNTPDHMETFGKIKFSLSRNMMALELGYYKKQVQNNVTDFLRNLDVLDKQLCHVNILEDLSRSLVLLKRKMNWELKDVMHLRIHTNSTTRQYVPLPSEAQLQQHRLWSSLDYTLYDHFLSRHKEEVAQQDASFHEEVQAFDEMQDDFSKFCSSIIADFQNLDCSNVTRSKNTHSNITGSNIARSNIICLREAMAKSHVIPSSSFHDAFKVTYADCAMLMVNEPVAKKALKYHMNPGVCEKRPRLAKKLRLSCQNKEHVLPGLTAHDLIEIVQDKPMKWNM